MSLLCPAMVNMVVHSTRSPTPTAFSFKRYFAAFGVFGFPTLCTGLCQQCALCANRCSFKLDTVTLLFLSSFIAETHILDLGKVAKGFDYVKERPFRSLHVWSLRLDVLNCSRRSREVPEWAPHLHSLALNSIRSEAHLWENRTELW